MFVCKILRKSFQVWMVGARSLGMLCYLYAQVICDIQRFMRIVQFIVMNEVSERRKLLY